MKKGMLICTGEGRYKNIGDYIQSIVAEVFFDSIDDLIEREKLNEYISEEKTLVIMNAWYMWHPENWPPSNDIIPLLVSIHINQNAKDLMLTGKGLEYFKQHEPIGCRDLGTLHLLQEKNIKAYFSGCLTLCLGIKYKTENKTNKIYFVDPYYECIKGEKSKFSIKNIVIPFLYGIRNYSRVKPLIHKIKYESKLSFLEPYFFIIERFLNASAFYKTYSSMFSNKVLYNAEYLTHSISQSIFSNEQDKLQYARNLLHLYSSAKLIVTSRIHCALPALGMETPTLFVTSDYLNTSRNIGRNGGRFEGLIDLFHVITYKNYSLENKSDIPSFIDDDVLITNKSDYLKIKENLVSLCTDFINKYA